jgi:hypothetical protein
MKLEITLSQHYVSDSLMRLRQAAKAEQQANGQLERLKCLQNDTKMQVGATETNGTQEIATKPQRLDQTEVAYEVRQTFYTRPKSDRRTVSTGEGDQGSIGQRICRYYEIQAEGCKVRQTICFTA